MHSERTFRTASAVGWAAFIGVTVWSIGFLAGVVPHGVDSPHGTPTAAAVLVDLALLLLFAFQHSVMARPRVKVWSRRFVPQPLERTCYVLATDLCLVLLLLCWQPWGGMVWHLTGAAALVLWGLFAAGWVLAIVSTFAVDHLELTGLRQAGWARQRETPSAVLQDGGLYGVVRHPLMTGLLVGFWATPAMGSSHLLFAAALTGYIVMGIRFEERDLRRTFGRGYDDYAARVPALFPFGTLPKRRVMKSAAPESVSAIRPVLPERVDADGEIGEKSAPRVVRQP